ncbi:MAG: ClpXP protease specificity-enhancing factor SspB [Pseudomonadota bacterium]
MTDYIGYDALTQAAMRGVVREAIRTAQSNCQTPGDHHFYITFQTRAPGVQIADYLVDQFPKDMTIVVQHQFWDLEVHDSHFEIILKFSGVPQHLRIPFSAITRFVDPSVHFGLTFDDARASNAKGGVLDTTTVGTELSPNLSDIEGETANTVVNLDAFRRK